MDDCFLRPLAIEDLAAGARHQRTRLLQRHLLASAPDRAMLPLSYLSIASSASYSASSFLDCIMRADRPDRIPLAPPPCDWRSIHIASARMIWFSKIARSI